MSNNETSLVITLQENMVNITKQLSLPLIEASLVISKYTKQLSMNLQDYAKSNNEELPESILVPFPIMGKETQISEEGYNGIPLEKIMEILDQDRMDIFDTLIRTSINIQQIPLFDALLVLRTWEKLVREQLVGVKSVGQLFSPVELPDEF